MTRAKRIGSSSSSGSTIARSTAVEMPSSVVAAAYGANTNASYESATRRRCASRSGLRTPSRRNTVSPGLDASPAPPIASTAASNAGRSRASSRKRWIGKASLSSRPAR
jgi:hypothetical protein